MKDLTFLLPCRIESEDRLRNVVTSVSYLLGNFPEAKVIVKEVDTHSHFKFRALPVISNYVNTDQLTHIYEENDDKFFHKTRILNDLLVASETDIVYNHDVDIVLPVQSYISAYNAINNNQVDSVYPFGCGVYQWAVNYPMQVFSQFLDSRFDFSVLESTRFRVASSIGWGQMIKRQVEIDVGLWNENYISWGAEDCEFYFRINSLGYKVGRVYNDVYHFEHGRTFNSGYNNPKFMDNHQLWQRMRTWDKNQIKNYYSQQNYLIERRKQLNVSI
jgi:cellulose synthase/poly-beta-1,6-N-acetylglucosamine synthase-like glycosyltransferase